jgi:hypothetical protein
VRINGVLKTSIPGRDFCQLFIAGELGERADEGTRVGLLALNR